MGEEFDHLVKEYQDFSHRDAPVGASFLGLKEFDGKWGDGSLEGVKLSLSRHLEFKKRFLGLQNLTPEEELDRKIVVALIDFAEIYTNDYSIFQRFPANGSQQVSSAIFMLLSRAEALDAHTCEGVISLLQGVPKQFTDANAHLGGKGICPISRQIALESASGAQEFFSALPAILSSAGYDITDVADKALQAVEEHIGFLKKLPEAPDDYATGKEIFSKMLQREHLLSNSFEEIEEMGKKLLADAKKNQSKLAKEIDSTRTAEELIGELKKVHPTADELQDTYKRFMESAKAFIIEHKLIDLPPNEQLDMIATPPFNRGIIPYAAYFGPAVYAPRQIGKFMVTPVEEKDPQKREEILRGHCTYRLPGVSLHEAYPGHHLQISWGTRTKRAVRKEAFDNIFIEGWALYCETMMTEEGYISKPEEKLFLANDLVWRAARVLVDIGIHCHNKGYPWAVEFMVKEAGLERPHAETECKRYISTPTQPLSYALGRMMLLELRSELKKKLRDKFSLRDFHNRLMQYGSIHLPLIIQEVKASYAP
jgi:hypothetical protein